MGHERSHIEDQILVMDAQDGDAEAMETLVKRWQKRLWQHALRLTGDESVAWDVTQSAWYDIVMGLRRLHDPASFRAWAYKITTYKSIDWIKAKRPAEPLTTEKMADLAAKPSTETGVDELLEKLDVDKRAVLYLYYYKEEPMNEKDIQNMLNETYYQDKEETLRGMIRDFYSRKNTSNVILIWSVALLCIGGAVVCGILFAGAEQTKFLILYATLFLVFMHWIDLMKIFAWQMIHRNSVKREIKRLEIRIAELSETVNKQQNR